MQHIQDITLYGPRVVQCVYVRTPLFHSTPAAVCTCMPQRSRALHRHTQGSLRRLPRWANSASSLPLRIPLSTLSLPLRIPLSTSSLPLRIPLSASSLPLRIPLSTLSLSLSTSSLSSVAPCYPSVFHHSPQCLILSLHTFSSSPLSLTVTSSSPIHHPRCLSLPPSQLSASMLEIMTKLEEEAENYVMTRLE